MTTEAFKKSTLLIEQATTDATAVPEWLNEEFLLKHLQNSFPEKLISIQNFHVKKASAIGENYTSVIYRVNVVFADESSNLQTVSIIMKVAPTSGPVYEASIEFDSFGKEVEFYGKIIPKITSLLREINEHDQLVPGFFGVCDVNSVILFEDMNSKGFKILPAQQGYNFEEAKVILKKIASVHAACAVLQEREPDIFQRFQHGLVTRASDKLNIFFESYFDVCLEVISTWPDFAHYTKKLLRIRSTLMERIRKIFDPKHFSTLAQGDLWTNNILVKPVEGSNFEDVILIDWAFACWTSPTIDLHYFFNISLDESLRPGKFDDLITVYHEQLTSTLNRLNYRKHIPTLDEFKQQFNDTIFYGFTSTLIQSHVLNESKENSDYDALTSNDERAMKFKRFIFSSPKVHANLRKMIPYFDQFGAFD